jgi:hypothetical protein
MHDSREVRNVTPVQIGSDAVFARRSAESRSLPFLILWELSSHFARGMVRAKRSNLFLRQPDLTGGTEIAHRIFRRLFCMAA